MGEAELDVRSVPKRDKHPQILACFDALEVGESFVLINDHDPKHLREEFEAEFPGGFSWRYERQEQRDWRIQIGKLASTPLPRILCDAGELLGDHRATDAAGAIWKLQMSRRQLDANIVRLLPNSSVGQHLGSDLDVLLHILNGDGRLETEIGTVALRSGELVWLPRNSRREIVAGPDGLTYFSVHPRRPGLTIVSRPDQP